MYWLRAQFGSEVGSCRESRLAGTRETVEYQVPQDRAAIPGRGRTAGVVGGCWEKRPAEQPQPARGALGLWSSQVPHQRRDRIQVVTVRTPSRESPGGVGEAGAGYGYRAAGEGGGGGRGKLRGQRVTETAGRPVLRIRLPCWVGGDVE